MSDENKAAAETMRRYIVAHLAEDLAPPDVTRAASYSHRHGSRVFKECTGKGIGEYIRLLRLSAAAQKLIDGQDNVLDIALSHQYDSHEGFTKAFSSAFGISPRAYRAGSYPIQFFIPYPVSLPPQLFESEDATMNTSICTATYISRPERTLIYLPSKNGVDYWSFCQEHGCDWEGLLLSVAGRMDTPAFLTLPPAMAPKGFSNGAVGIEVPADYAGAVPEGYRTMPLPATEMLYFQSPAYEDEENYAQMIQMVYKAYEEYDPAPYGYEFAPDAAPAFNFGAFAESGARIAVPVRKK